MRIAAIGDLHCSRNEPVDLGPVFGEIDEQADVLLLCGDLTDNGMPQEAEMLAGVLEGSDLPIVAVLGNHDHEKQKQDEIERILRSAGVRLLDGDSWEMDGIAFVGIKGFAGGFRERELQPWGEPQIKAFVNEAVQEGLKLESALSRLDARRTFVLMHYAPVPETLAGEPPEIYPFLGSSRLERAIDRHTVHAVFHAHAHHGRSRGATEGGVPVFNVSMAVLRREDRAGRTFRVIDAESGEVVG